MIRCINGTEIVVHGEKQRLVYRPKRDENSAFVFLKILSETFLLVFTIKGQEVNLFSSSLEAGLFAFSKHKESPRDDYYNILIT